MHPSVIRCLVVSTRNVQIPVRVTEEMVDAIDEEVAIVNARTGVAAWNRSVLIRAAVAEFIREKRRRRSAETGENRPRRSR